MDTAIVKETLIWIAFSGGSGVLAFYLWEQLERWSEKVKGIAADVETYITLALTGSFAVMAYIAMMALNYIETPVGADEWIKALLAVFGTAIGVTKVLHGAKRYRERRR